MLTKSAPMRVKADTADGAPEGSFEAVVSVFDNVDTYGDVVRPGAFTDTLAEWKAGGLPIPVLWSHMSADPDYHIGFLTEAAETAEGLHVKGQIDLEGPGKGPQVHRLLREGRVSQMSFAYDVLDGGPVEVDGQSVFELRRLKLYEVGPCLVGVNQQTRLVGAKADDGLAASTIHAMTALLAEVKAGRVLSASNEARIRTAVVELSAVLAALADDAGKTRRTTPARAKDEGGDAKSEEPSPDLAAIKDIELAALAAAG